MEFKAWMAEASTVVGGEIIEASVKAEKGKPAAAPGADAEDVPVTDVFEGQGEYEIILEQADLDRWIELLKKSDLFALDTETTSLNC